MDGDGAEEDMSLAIVNGAVARLLADIAPQVAAAIVAARVAYSSDAGWLHRGASVHRPCLDYCCRRCVLAIPQGALRATRQGVLQDLDNVAVCRLCGALLVSTLSPSGLRAMLLRIAGGNGDKHAFYFAGELATAALEDFTDGTMPLETVFQFVENLRKAAPPPKKGKRPRHLK